MISLARTTLRRDWRRFVPAVFAVGFAGLLVIMQLALMLGIFRTVSVTIDQSTADLWVGYPDTPSVDLARPMTAKNEVFLRGHADVTAVESFQWRAGSVRRADGSAANGVIIGLSTRADAMMLARVLTTEQRRLLDEPDTVLIDASNADNLGARLGGWLEINGRRAKVVGLTQGLGAIGGPNIVSSLDTARVLDPSGSDEEVSYYLVRLRDPARSDQVRVELSPTGPTRHYQVWTAQELSVRSQLYWLLETGMGLGFIFSGMLGLIIGVVITSQTLKAVINSSLREYATLRALGVSLRSLRLVVVEQAGWVGLAGAATTLAVGATLVELGRAGHVLIVAPWWAHVGTLVFVIVIALVSGLLALGTLTRAEPASLLR
ncbi:MAG: hypothetical protein H2172_14050 [Opitutus sp.]|nr:hypothetical protein [Opitutus sp.]MCS6248464.1 hypothetical protein [Opitutus sp.]MCS6274446.1 hypothetical protein [Opitutus sp.]MCS6277598.1 hypothetical protein [Opitutus sp.]MCS6300716.1 hypothetical protein [Opitutus sp.]